MGNNIIIEFAGLPGSGKSYLSHKLADGLREKGFAVSEPSYVFDHNLVKPLRLISKLFYCLFFVLFHPQKYSEIKKVVRKNGYGTFKSFHKQCLNLCIKISQFTRKTKKIRIFDEGIIQAAVSLSAKDVFPVNNNISFLVEQINDFKSLVFIIKEDIDVCLERMESRRTNDSRIEQLPSQDRREYAMKIERIINSVEQDKNHKMVVVSKYDEIVNHAENYLFSMF